MPFVQYCRYYLTCLVHSALLAALNIHAVSESFLNYSCDSDLRLFESEFATPDFCSAAKGKRTGASDALDHFGHRPKLHLLKHA